MARKKQEKVSEDISLCPAEETEQEKKELKVGYAVGITDEGQFDFAIFGSEPGLVELMGLHKFAELRIQKLLQEKQMSGDTLVHEVGRAVAALHQKVDQLMGTTQPSNKLK